MSDIMQGVLRMPPDLWTGDPLDVSQRYVMYMQAADLIKQQAAEIEQLQAENERLKWENAKPEKPE